VSAVTSPVPGNLVATQVAAEVERLGGEVIASWSNADRKADHPDVVVLAYMAGQWQPWVTWTNSFDGGLTWGHYFAHRKRAWADFIARCEGYGAS
jgi:hypothetical protein